MHSFLNVKYALIKTSLNLLLVLVLNLQHLPYIAAPAELGDRFMPRFVLICCGGSQQPLSGRRDDL